MSHQVISHSPDIKQLRNEGFEVEIRGAYLLLHHVPYLTSDKKVNYGTLVTDVQINGNLLSKPASHVIHFEGDYPCNLDGYPINAIKHVTQDRLLGENIQVNHSFSNRPSAGYKDYYEKLTAYLNIISAPAEAVDPKATSKTFKVIHGTEEEKAFQYLDTNSSRADICQLSECFRNQRIAIVGMGGTGSYILDLVSKTPVKEIHIIDGDFFLQHNAFRAPGAASLSDLDSHLSKVSYWKKQYSYMHKGIVAHEYYLDGSKLENLLPFNYVFIAIDNGEVKEELINILQNHDISFVDVGIGVEQVKNSLIANIRTTSSSPLMKDHIKGNKRISFTNEAEDLYSSNIQIAELNSLSAAFAVFKWKKSLGFYFDDENEHHSVMNINSNILSCDDSPA